MRCLQAWQNALDNHVPNLWMGSAVDNQAAGGLRYNLNAAGEQIERLRLSGADAAAAVKQILDTAGGRPRGSARGGRRSWRRRCWRRCLPTRWRRPSWWRTCPTVPISTGRAVTGTSSPLAALLLDLPQHRWAPEAYSAEDLQQVLEGFLSLQAPDPEFSPDLLDDTGTVVSDSTYRSLASTNTSFVGDEDAVVSGRRARPGRARWHSTWTCAARRRRSLPTGRSLSRRLLDRS